MGPPEEIDPLFETRRSYSLLIPDALVWDRIGTLRLWEHT